MTESGLATFRIEKERWARFQQLAKDSNSNASKLIISFIDACLDNRIDIDDYTITQPKSAISTSGIDEYLDNNLDTRIGNYLEKNLNSYLDSRIDELPIRELIRASVETALDPIRESVETLEAVASRAVEIPAAIATPNPDTEDSSEDIPSVEVQRIITNFEKEPELKARVISGLEQGFVGAALGNWLAEGGFLNSKGEKHAGSRLSKFKTAIEWMEKST
jgi:hypothetical protein